jgi:predicted MPP superfamily phosphohydrolase
VKAGKYLTLLLFVLVVSLAYHISAQISSYANTPSQQNTSVKDDNCVLNNGFEEGINNSAVGWTYQNDTSTKIYRVDSVSCEGNYSYYMWSNTSAINTYSEYFSIIPGSYYNVSYSVKTSFPTVETAPGYYLEVLARNSTSEDTIRFSSCIKVTVDWTRCEYNWQVPVGHNYTKARLRLNLILANNTGTGNGAFALTDDVVVKPEIYSVICSQPFLLDYENLPTTLNFSAQFINSTIPLSLDANDFTVKLGEQNLTVRSVAFNESTQLYDITADVPSLQKGRYMLKLLYGSQESLNFKGVNVYQFTGNFSFIHWTDLHYNPPEIGYESQLNVTLKLLKNADPEFIVMTGDMCSSEYNYQRFYAIMKSIDFDVPIFFANGNHEKETATTLKDAVLYMGEKKIQFGSEYPFTFDFGNYHFIGLDSGVLPYSSPGNISDVQYNWLKNELQSNRDKRLIALCHHPLYFSGGTKFWSSNVVAENVMNLFADYGVVAVFAGHAHRSQVCRLTGTSTFFYTTVSGSNCTHWIGGEPFPPSGFRTIEVVNDAIVKTTITDLFSYYTGDFVMASKDAR